MLKSAKTCKGITATKKDKAGKTNPIEINICNGEIDQGTPSLSNNNSSMAGITSSLNKSDKSVKHQTKPKFVVRFKKATSVDLQLKNTRSTYTKRARRKPSLINQNSVQKQKCEGDVSNNPDSFDAQAACCKKLPALKQHVKKQRCKDDFDDIASSPLDLDTQAETFVANGTLLKQSQKRLKSQNGLSLCGVSLERQPVISKRRKSKDEDFGHSADGSHSQTVTVSGKGTSPIKAVRRKSNDVLLPSAVSSDTLAVTSLANETPSKKSLKRLKSQDGLSLYGVGLESHLVTSKRRKSIKNVQHSSDGLNTQAVTFLEKNTSPKKAVRRKSTDFLVPSAVSLCTQPITSLNKEPFSPRALRASNRRKSKEDLEPSAESLFYQSLTLEKELSPKKVVKKRKSKDVLAPRAMYSETQLVTPIDGEQIKRRPSNVKAQDSNVDCVVDSNTQCAVSIENGAKQKGAYKTQKLQKMIVNEHRSEPSFGLLDTHPVMGLPNKYHIANNTVEGHMSSGLCTNIFDYVTMEDYLLNDTPTASPEASDSYDQDCTETESAKEDISEQDDPSENVRQHLVTQIFEVADVSKSVCVNFDERTSVESALDLPESQSESKCTSTDNVIIKSCPIKSSPIKECNIILERLDLRGISEFKQKHRTQEKAVSKFPKPSSTTNFESGGPSNSCLVTNDYIAPNTTFRPKLKKARILKLMKCPQLDESNCKDVSAVDHTVTNREIVHKLPKPSTTNFKSVEPSNSCLVTNDIAPNTTFRPKLNKASILKLKCPKLVESNCKDVSVVDPTETNREIDYKLLQPSSTMNDYIPPNTTFKPKLKKASILKLKCPNFKQIKTVNKTNNLVGLERTVAICGDRKDITSIVITKHFTKPEMKDNKNMGTVRDEFDSEESSVTKENLQNAYVSKSIKTRISFNDDVDPLSKLVKDKPRNNGVVKLTEKNNTELRGKASLVCEQYDNQESAVTKRNLQNARGPKSNKSCITCNDDFDLLNKKVRDTPQDDGVVKLKTHEELRGKYSLVCEQYENKKSAVTKQNLQSARGPKSNKSYISFNDDFDPLNQKVEDNSQNVGVLTLKTHEDNKLEEKTVTTEPNLRKQIPFREKDKFDKIVNHNSPSPCINIRSNFSKQTEPSIQSRELSSDFSFTQPKVLPNQKVMLSNYNEDILSEMSFFVSNELENDIDNTITEPKQKETTWNKFDRFTKNSDDEEDEEDDDYNNCKVVTSKSNDIKEKSGVNKEVHSDENEDFEYREHSYAPSPSTIEKFALWNRLNEKWSSKNDNQPKQTNTFRVNKDNNFCDDLSVKDPLQGSPLKGYCILYFRASTDDHTCNLIHKVPYHLFSNISQLQADTIDCAISEIINKNFNNPPEALVFTFVSFCIQFNKRNTLVHLGKCLKSNVNVRCPNEDKANTIWYNFVKALIDSKYVVMSNIHKCRFISTTLHKIFGENIDLKDRDAEVFAVILRALVKVHSHYKSELQLLTCVSFVIDLPRKRVNLELISPEFAISVIKQCLDATNQSHQSSSKFAYKVSKLFFTDFAYVEALYKHDKNVVTLFVETVESRGFVDWSRNEYKVKRLAVNGLEKPLLESRKRSESRSPSSRNLTKTCDLSTVRSASDALGLCAALEKIVENGEVNLKEIYYCFETPSKKDQLIYALTLLKDHVRERLSDVIMSLISHEANNNRWNISFKLYKNLLQFDPMTIQNLFGDNSPASNVLTVVLVLLKNNQITEALDLFTKYSLCNDHDGWSLDYLPQDIVTSRHICSIFKDTIQSLDDETLYSVTIKLVTVQKSLAEPIDLTVHMSSLFNRLIERRLHSKTVKLLSLIFDENKSKLLTLPSGYLYRTLVIILCIEEDLTHASMVFLKAEKRVHLYPIIPKRITAISPVEEMSVELYSCLTQQEMKVIVFAILKLHGEIIKNSGFYVKWKLYYNHSEEIIPEVFKPYMSVKDCTVPTAIKRFIESVRDLIPNALFKNRGHDGIEIDKISLKEYMYNLNKSDLSDED